MIKPAEMGSTWLQWALELFLWSCPRLIWQDFYLWTLTEWRRTMVALKLRRKKYARILFIDFTRATDWWIKRFSCFIQRIGWTFNIRYRNTRVFPYRVEGDAFGVNRLHRTFIVLIIVTLRIEAHCIKVSSYAKKGCPHSFLAYDYSADTFEFSL